MNNPINNKFYDFINLYNAIIKHCVNKERQYTVNLYYIENQLYLKVIDKFSNIVLHNENIECNEIESKLIYNLITSEFILNHQLKYAAFSPMTHDDILSFKVLTSCKNNVTCDNNHYYNNGNPMKIHRLENSIFTLNVYEYYGVDEQTELLHNMALDKINKHNVQLIKKENQIFNY